MLSEPGHPALNLENPGSRTGRNPVPVTTGVGWRPARKDTGYKGVADTEKHNARFTRRFTARFIEGNDEVIEVMTRKQQRSEVS